MIRTNSVTRPRKGTRSARESGKKPPVNPATPPWTQKELALLGKLPDKEAAARTGRTVKATQLQREQLKIPAVRARGRR